MARRSTVTRLNANFTLRHSMTETPLEQLQEYHVATHTQVISAAVSAGVFPQNHITITDGRLGRPFWKVRPGGRTIARERVNWEEVIKFVRDRLLRLAPVHSGVYKRSFIEERKGNEEWTIINTAAHLRRGQMVNYSWVIERVNKNWKKRTTFKLMQKTANVARRKYKGNVYVQFMWHAKGPAISIRNAPFGQHATIQ